MTTRSARQLALTICVIASCAGACRGNPATSERSTQATGVDAPGVPALPDLSRLDESLQQRIRTEYAQLTTDRRRGAEDRAEANGRMGMLLFAAEHAAAAEPFFTSARTLNPTDMRWPYYLGHLHLALRQPEKASTFFEESRRLQPKHVPSLVWLGDAYLTLGRPDEAERHLAHAVEVEPSSAAAWLGRGRAALALRDYRRAIAHLDRALALDPRAGAVHYQMGLAYRAIGNRSAAEEHLKQRGDAAPIRPSDPLIDALPGLLQTGAAYLTRGVEALERREWPVAIENLRKAEELSPGDTGIRLNLGTALFLNGDRAGARREFEAAVRLSPDLPKPHYTLGLLAEAEMRDREAIDHFASAVRLDPDYVEAHASLGDALRRSGRTEPSLVHYAKVLSLNPSASQARFGYAMALVRLGRYREARDWLRQAAAMHPDQPGFSHALARLLAAAPDDNVRNGGEAWELTERLLQSHRSAPLSETMAMAAAERGRFADAIRWQQAAIDAAVAAAQHENAARMQENLMLYRKGLPCRTPWRADDPVHFPRPAS
jgi:tetratricopeptide (TPR) repeat protein